MVVGECYIGSSLQLAKGNRQKAKGNGQRAMGGLRVMRGGDFPYDRQDGRLIFAIR